MDWYRILINNLTGHLLLEIIFRTIIMFLIILFVLRISGKRGVRQLSVFEVAIIIGLGSAAGDPMFNEDIAIIPAFIVCLTAILLYRLITFLAAKIPKFEQIIEGKPLYIVEDGVMVIKEINNNAFSQDEFFAELRLQSVEHLGQIKVALLETTGDMSIYFFEDEDVQPGLPILPKEYHKKTKTITDPDDYACSYCGAVEHLSSTPDSCKRCDNKEWVKAIKTRRIK
jgi:uncharacterized membrane protein YcaP (DUF421 family)